MPCRPDCRTSAASNFLIYSSLVWTVGMVVRMVDLIHKISYLMYARLDHADRGPDVSKLNYNTCLIDDPVRMGIHVAWTVAVIFPYLCFGKKS